jgi:hypothetical protein
MACYILDSLWVRVTMVASNDFARFMWVWISDMSPLPWDIYITLPTSSNSALHKYSDCRIPAETPIDLEF